MPARADTQRVGRPDGASAAIRVLDSPIGFHALALAALLAAVAVALGTGASFSGDEGAAILQAEHLALGEGWLVPYEMRSVDPDADRLFIQLSEIGPEGYAPYAKHPTYPIMLAAADQVGSVTAMVGLSIAGAVGAALAAAGLASRYQARASVPAFWVAALATPILFNSQVVLAHTLGAAAAGGATVAVVALRERWRFGVAVVAVCCVVLLAALRTEGTLFAAALGLICVVMAVRGRDLALGVLGALIGVAGLGVLVLDRMALNAIVGGGSVITSPATGDSDLIGSRIRGFARMLIAPGSSWGLSSQLAVLALVGAAVLGAAATRRGFSRPLWAAAVLLATLGSIGVLLSPDPDLVEGLFTASPVLLAGILMLDRDVLRDRTLAPAAGTAVVFTIAVVVTQYERGGAAEWGARFLAIELPILAVLAVAGFRRVSGNVPQDLRLASFAVIATAGIVTAIASVRALDYYKDNTRQWIEVTAEASGSARPTTLDTGDSRPVVVTTWLSLGRMLWPLEERPAGLYVEPDDLPSALADLRAAGVEEVVLALTGGADELRSVEDDVEVIAGFPSSDGPLWVVRLD